MAVVFPQGIEVFANSPSCVAAAGSGGTNGTSSPAAGTTESWTMSTGYTSFPVAQNSTAPNNYFYIRDPADTTNEIVLVYVNGGNNSSWSVQRGMNGATAAHASGATWVQVVSPYTLQNFKQASTANTAQATISTSTTETVLLNYTPLPGDISTGTTWDIFSFGTVTAHGGTSRGTVAFNLYWGGSGAVNGAFTSTGSTMIGSLKTGTNAPGFAATTVIAGASFDVNCQVVALSATPTLTANMNLYYQGASALSTAASNATCVNVTSSGGASSSTAISPTSTTGPIILTCVWTANFTVYGITSTTSICYRSA